MTDDWLYPVTYFANKMVADGCTERELAAGVEKFAFEHFADSPELQLLAQKFARDAARSFNDRMKDADFAEKHRARMK